MTYGIPRWNDNELMKEYKRLRKGEAVETKFSRNNAMILLTLAHPEKVRGYYKSAESFNYAIDKAERELKKELLEKQNENSI